MRISRYEHAKILIQSSYVTRKMVKTLQKNKMESKYCDAIFLFFAVIAEDSVTKNKIFFSWLFYMFHWICFYFICSITTFVNKITNEYNVQEQLESCNIASCKILKSLKWSYWCHVRIFWKKIWSHWNSKLVILLNWKVVQSLQK